MKMSWLPPGPLYSRTKSALLIATSCALTLAAFFSLRFFGDREEVKVTKIEVRGEGVPPAFFAEALDLTPGASLSLDVAQKRLQELPFLQKVSVGRKRSGTLSIAFALRTPIASVHNYRNTAIDSEGVLFPLEGFYYPKKLPCLILPTLDRPPWGARIDLPQISLFHDLVRLCGDLPLSVIDLSRIEAPTLGKREIVVGLAEEVWLRLSVKGYAEELAHFKRLWKEGLPGGERKCMIDLRIRNLAFIREV